MADNQEFTYLTRSEQAELFLKYRQSSISFDLYPHSKYLLDLDWSPSILIKWGRQSGKSMTVNMAMLLDAKFERYNQLYLTPLQSQAKAFSVIKFKSMLKSSRLLWPNFYTPGNSKKSGTDNVFFKLFDNEAYTLFSYAQDDPDRVRSYTFDRIVMDEIQDIDVKTVGPVIEACTFQALRNEIVYSGTPKSLDNDIELLWSESTQHEWMVKCNKCNTYNMFISTKTIGLDGPICARCGGPLNPLEGQFIPLNPSGVIKGFHFARTAIVISKNEEVNRQKWKTQILSLMDRQDWTESKFYNEVLGVSHGKGTRVVERKDLIPLQVIPKTPINSIKANFIGIGIDWGGSDYTHKLDRDIQSQTAIAIIIPYNNGFGVVHYEKLTVSPIEDIEKIINIINTVKPNVVFADAGGGLVQNANLFKLCATNGIVFSPVQWGTPNKILSRTGDKYIANKTAIFDAIMLQFLQKKIFLPVDSGQLIEEILNEHVETQESGRKVWKRVKSKMDDLLHAVAFGWMGIKMFIGDHSLPNGLSLMGEISKGTEE